MDEIQRAFEEWSSVYYADTDFTKVTEDDEEFDFGWLYKDNMTQLSWEAWRKAWQAATMAERERMEEGYNFLVRRIETLEKYQAEYNRNQQRMPSPFGR